MVAVWGHTGDAAWSGVSFFAHAERATQYRYIIPPFLLFLIQVFGANTEVGKTVITAGLLRAAVPNVRDVMRCSRTCPFVTATTLGILANNKLTSVLLVDVLHVAHARRTVR